MTSIAFIAGVIPLVLATGAGAEIRQAMGVVVFAGMIGVTVFGLLLTPVFYVLMRKAAHKTSATVDGHALTGGRPVPAAALPSPDRDHA
jgi:Cu/Ag efflux pump CusA